MNKRVTWTAVALVGLAATAVGACDEQPDCYEGDFLACSCGEDPGFQRCGSDGRYGACLCDGTVPGLEATTTSSTGGAGGAGGMGLIPFMEPCESSERCETGLCGNYPSKGDRCTMPCNAPADCPPPSPGCNNMGVCKAP